MRDNARSEFLKKSAGSFGISGHVKFVPKVRPPMTRIEYMRLYRAYRQARIGRVRARELTIAALKPS